MNSFFLIKEIGVCLCPWLIFFCIRIELLFLGRLFLQLFCRLIGLFLRLLSKERMCCSWLKFLRVSTHTFLDLHFLRHLHIFNLLFFLFYWLLDFLLLRLPRLFYWLLHLIRLYRLLRWLRWLNRRLLGLSKKRPCCSWLKFFRI